MGGRVRTDEVDGFPLDRGSQVLLTAYPEAQQVFDYSKLELKHFEPGALIRYQGKFHRFAGPWRRDGLFACGDYMDTASVPGAMISGRRAAEQIIGLRSA